MAEIALGSVSTGTMREEDLIPCFMAVLEEHAPDRAAHVKALYGLGDPHGLLCDTLFDELGNIAPEGVRFGAHEGDGADYGFWPVEDD